MPRNVRGGLRMSTALTHLAAARGRPNLAIRPGALADRIELSGTTVRGIRLAGGESVAAGRVVVAAGSHGSPAIMLRSGIGPAGPLRDLGIRVAADLPGVGENLTDHPLVAVDLPTSPGYTGPVFQVMLTMHSSHAGPGGPPDPHLFAAGPFDDPASPTGGVFGIVAGCCRYGRGGRSGCAHPTPPTRPASTSVTCGDPVDMARMVEATRHARQLSRTQPLARFVTGAEPAPGPAIGDDDTAGLGHSIKERVGSYHHPVGTRAMGPEPAAGAVVDATLLCIRL
jgi:choline dehydrogenase-like flavoprotein